MLQSMKNNLYVFFLFFITGLMSCSHHSGLYEHAEKIMSQHPDSVLTLLSTIQDVNDLSEKDRAMYYLLLTEAQNKTYIKPTSDSLITIAVEFFDKTEDWERKAKAWYYRGRINQDLGDALHAQDYYLKALQDESKVEDHALLGRIYNSIGMLYTYQNVYEKALPYQRKALDRFALMQDSVGISYVLRDIGRTFTALEKNDSAKTMRDRAKPGQKRGDIMRIEGEEVTVMKEPVLVIMAAGMGSRYGGLKQIDPMDKEGHILIDFSLYDARKAGFHKVVFIIKKENEADFKAVIGNRIEKSMEVSYVYQDWTLPEGFSVPEGRTKPFGTGHAVLCCAPVIDGPFAVINADDYYGKHAFSLIYEHLARWRRSLITMQWSVISWRRR